MSKNPLKNEKRRNRQKAFIQLIKKLNEFDDDQLADLAYRADVNIQTLKNWKNKVTFLPHFYTMVKVANELNLEFYLQAKKNASKPRPSYLRAVK